MSKLPLVAVSLSCALPGAPPAAGHIAQAPDCSDDRGVDRCADEQQRRMRELYGVRAIEEHRNAGDQVRRVFYVHGSGRDLILIVFARAPGSDPIVSIHYPQPPGGPRVEPLRALVPQSVWDEVLSRSREFDRTFVRRQDDPPDICIHSWVYTVEAVDRPRGRLPAEVRRKTEDACANGPAGTYAMEVPRLALPLFPACVALDPTQHRNHATMLDACRILQGDRLAAAEVFNLAGVFRRVSTREETGLLYGRFDHRGIVDWNGARNTGEGTALRFWVDRIFADGQPSFLVRSVHGESADRVILSAFLRRSVDSPGAGGSRHEEADVEQIWVRDFNGDMRIESATVGPWRRPQDR